MREPTPQALLAANIVFDFRPLFGDTTLADALRDVAVGLHAGEPDLPAADGAERARSRAAAWPDPRLRHRRWARNAREPLDLKTRGTRLFVDAARVFALALGIAETGTATRLRLAGKRLHVEDRHVAGDDRSLPFPAAAAASPAGSRRRSRAIPTGSTPDELNEVEQRMLKEALPPGETAAAAPAPFLSALSAASVEVRACVDESSGAHGRFPAGRAQGRRRGRAPAQSVAEHSERGPDATALPPALCRRRHRDHRCRSQARPAHRHRRRRGGAQSHRASRLLRNGAAAGQGERATPTSWCTGSAGRHSSPASSLAPGCSSFSSFWANRRSSRFAPSSTRR